MTRTMAAGGQRRPNDRLRAKRLERGLTQEEAAGELSRLRWQENPKAPDFTGDMFSRWERGQRPRPQHRRLICELLRCGADELWSRPARLVADDGQTDRQTRYDGRTKRRTFLVGGVGTVAGLAGVASTSTTPDPLLTAMNRLHRLAGSSIGAAIDGYEAVIVDLGLNYSREPVSRVYTRVDSLLTNVQAIIDSEPPKGYQRRLHSLAGWSAGLLANALHDVNDSAAATANAALALEYGRLAGDARLMAYIYDRQAMFAAEAQHLAAALRLVQEGRQAAPERTAISVRLRSSEARMQARLGRHGDALGALHALQDEYEHLPAAEVGEGSFHVSSAFLDGCAGTVLVSLGQWEAAEPHLRRSIAHYETASSQERRPTRLANSRLKLSLALLGAGRPDEASALAVSALETDRLTAGLVREASQVDAALTTKYPDLPEARDFRERYQALEVPADV